MQHPILDHLGVLSDPIRARLLFALERQELTVGELCDVLDVPQSTASRHLRHLVDAAWIDARREGNRNYYRLAVIAEKPSGRLWELVREEVSASTDIQADRERLADVLESRRAASDRFFAETAADWEQLRADLYGHRFDLVGLLGLLDPTWVVGDLGCGTGLISDQLAPFVGQVVGVDASAEMLTAARARCRHHENVEFRRGSLENPPLDPNSLDAAVLFLTLQYLAEPGAVFVEAAKALRAGAPMLVVDIDEHRDDAFRESMGHVWNGFGRERLQQALEDAGLLSTRWMRLPSSRGDAPGQSKAPGLFVATARRPPAVELKAVDPGAARHATR